MVVIMRRNLKHTSSLQRRSSLRIGAAAIVGVALFWGAQVNASTSYRLTDLGNLGAYTNEFGTSRGAGASAINNVGDIVGFSWGSTGAEAFVWSPRSGMRGLGYLDPNNLPNPESWAAAINSAGQTVGASVTQDHGDRAAFWSTTGQIESIAEVGGSRTDSYSYGTGINNSGMAVGYGFTAGDKVAFTWTAADGTKLLRPQPGFTVDGTGGINASGQFTGVAYDIIGRRSRAFIWDSADKIRLLDPLSSGETFSAAVAINNAGTVVGRSIDSTTFSQHAFIWDTQTGMRDLGTLSEGLNEVFANAINNSGHVVGRAGEGAGDSRAFVWAADLGMKDLNLLVDQDDPLHGLVTLDDATGINDLGQIVANAFYEGSPHAYLLTPVPEPGSVLLMLLGLPMVASARKYCPRPAARRTSAF